VPADRTLPQWCPTSRTRRCAFNQCAGIASKCQFAQALYQGPCRRATPSRRLQVLRGERPRRDLLRWSWAAPWGESEQVGDDVRAVRAIAPDATIPNARTRPYYLASIATSAEADNVANSGDSLVPRACLTQDLTRLRDPYGQGSRASGHLEWVARLPLAEQSLDERAKAA